jgi:hypothetical protein
MYSENKEALRNVVPRRRAMPGGFKKRSKKRSFKAQFFSQYLSKISGNFSFAKKSVIPPPLHSMAL